MCRRGYFDFLRPVLGHPFEKINKPLTRDVVAEEDEEQEQETDGGSNDVVHVRVSGKLSAEHSYRTKTERTFHPFEGCPPARSSPIDHRTYRPPQYIVNPLKTWYLLERALVGPHTSKSE